MSQQAKVNSVIMLKEWRSSLAKFATTASGALDEVSSEIQRTLTWLHEDRRRHWTNQVRLRRERYVQAKLALKRRGIFDLALTGAHTSAIDEKKALAIAERQLREAERRLARTRSWILRIEKELSDYRAATQGLSGAVDMAIPTARARLEKMVESLEAYAALAPPETAPSVDTEASETVLRPEAMVQQASSASPDVKSKVQQLRKLTPSSDVRRETPLGSPELDWIDAIKPSETLRRAAQDSVAEPIAPHPNDKVLLAQSEEEPGIAYLERTNPQEGDSGWYLGLDSPSESAGCVAIRVADLLKQCPDLEAILNLPVGYFVLMDTREPIEALYDAQDRQLWPGADSAASEAESFFEP